MAIYRTVQLSFWTDTKVEEDFTPEDKYFYLYLFTNPHTNLCGCYELGARQAARETGYNEDTILRLFDRFEKVHNVIAYSKATKEVLILNWHRYNWTKSGDFLKGLDKHIERVKNTEFKQYLKDLSNGIERVYRPSVDGRGTSVTVTDTVTNANTGTGNIPKVPKEKPSDVEVITKNTVPPPVDVVEQYCRERNNGINAEHFCDYYAARGWKLNNGKKMVDWQAAVRTWESNDKKRKTEQPKKGAIDWDNV